MRVLLTGGSGDLGALLCRALPRTGDEAIVLDVVRPRLEAWPSEFVQGSLLDREAVGRAMALAVDVVVHIAAWHGVHEASKSPSEFHDLNVTGTFNALEAAATAGVKKVVFISSTSARDTHGLYGHTKVLGEEMCRAYAERHDMCVVVLRPRGFIPFWNTVTYGRGKYVEWARWFTKGAVHISDVERCVLAAIEYVKTSTTKTVPVLTVDGAYEFTANDLVGWEDDGGTFIRRYGDAAYELMVRHGLDPCRKPTVLDMAETVRVLGYRPQYGLRRVLEELSAYGAMGPPAPF